MNRLAIFDCDGNLTNSSELDTRADERANDYYNSLHDGREYLTHIFAAAADDLLPGPQVESVAWEDRGLGTRTTVYRSRKHLPICEYDAGICHFALFGW